MFNPTLPLPFATNHNNKIYEFSPEQVNDDRELKRSKSVKSLDSKIYSLPRTPSRRRRRKLTVTLPVQQVYTFHGVPSDSEFSFSSSSDSDMDLESLPDLVNDNNTPIGSPSILTPKNLESNRFGKFFDDYKPIPFDISQFQKPRPVQHKSSIFDIPEIVYKIVEFASIQNDNSPQECSPIRRKPMSYNHALLIHGNSQSADESMTDDDECFEAPKPNVLYNCSLVNKLFNSCVNEIIGNKFYFTDERSFKKFVNNHSKGIKFKPTEFKLNKLPHLTKEANLIFSAFDFKRLETIELFMCPKYLPSAEFFQYGENIKRISVCGSFVLDDEFLKMVGEKCPNLQSLDIRGCELVTDYGIYSIGQVLTKLTSINFGRKNRGHLVTDTSLSKLIKNNTGLVTVGLAGCHITDKTIWDLTAHCNYTVERLSLNNCPFITNQSIPLIVHANYLPVLNVLELRLTNVTNLKPLIEFKRRQEFNGISILIELCEALSLQMRQQEIEMDKIISQRIFNDIQDWANDSDDGDSCYLTLLNSRVQ